MGNKASAARARQEEEEEEEEQRQEQQQEQEEKLEQERQHDALLRQPGSLELVSVETKAVRDEASGLEREEMSFKLHKKNLQHVMDQVVGLPVAIVSVAGAFRSGKSFLLSCFLRILEASDSASSSTAFEEGFLGGKPGTTDGFSWKAGPEAHTRGMLVWSKPFIREVANRRGVLTKMAVLLVDTQGTFDSKTETKLEACLFGLSATLSSCQIFNVMKHVQANTLGSLAVYLEIGTVAHDNSGNEEDSQAPFQRLEVLNRDWQFWDRLDDPIKLPCEKLSSEFLKYIDDILDQGTPDIKKIKECFRDDIGCFSLPDPGEDVKSRSFDGDVTKITEGFKRLVAYYTSTVILGELKATSIPNRLEGEFVLRVEEWVQLFSDGLSNGKLPEAKSWLGVIRDAENDKQMGEIVDDFKRDMDECTQKFVNPVMLQKCLEALISAAVLRFKPRGDVDSRDKAKEKLLHELNKEVTRAIQSNENRKEPKTSWTKCAVSYVLIPLLQIGFGVLVKGATSKPGVMPA